MKHFLFTLSIVLILLSCDNEDMKKEEEQCYLTVTYFSEGHTSGEVPPEEKFPILATDSSYIHPYRVEFTVAERGTLQKEGVLLMGWVEKNTNVIGRDYPYYTPGMRLGISFMENGDRYVELHAYWADQ